MKRRKFLQNSTHTIAGVSLFGLAACGGNSGKNDGQSESEASMNGSNDLAKELFKISLAEWSLHKSIFDGKISNLDFARVAREEFDIDAIEYVNQFFKDKAKDTSYLDDLNKRADDHGIYQHLIMIDGEGGMAHLDDSERMKAVDNHKKWVEAAKYLGCKTIRVNAYGEGSAEDVQMAAVDGLGTLSEFAKEYDINIVVENHGGYSSNGEWLAGVMKQVNMPNCGTLPDFGNFCIKRSEDGCAEEYDRYKGVKELMPFAHAVSAKTHDFGADGMEKHTDYNKMMDIVLDAGFHGYVGIEYEGSNDDEMTGIQKTVDLLKKVRAEKS